MFCSNCGNPVEDGAKFCEHCGAQLRRRPAADMKETEDGNVGASAVNVHARSKKSISGKAVAVAVVVVLLLAVGAFVYSDFSNTLDLNKYVTVTFEGYNGQGKAHAKLDIKKLHKDWGKKLKIKDKDVQKTYESLANMYDGTTDYSDYDISGKLKDNLAYIVLLSGIENNYYLNAQAGLSNGNAVELYWNVQDVYTDNGPKSLEDALGIKIKADEKLFAVEGLKEYR